jgi:hypothetical protein
LSLKKKKKKNNTQVMHHAFSGIELNITSGKEEGLVARMDSKSFKHFGVIVEFLPHVQLFAKEVKGKKEVGKVACVVHLLFPFLSF